jgi:hypothetical protein
MTMHRSARAAALGLLTLLLVACAGATAATPVPDPAAPSPSGAPSVEPSAAPTDPAADPAIAAAIAFRQEMGLRSDLGWVQAVAANPDATLDYGVPLLPFEAAELESRPGGEDPHVQAAQAYLAEHADVSGGLYLDNQRGGVLTVLVTREPEVHEAALRELVGDAPFVVRQVRWTEAELNQLQERLFQERSFFDSIPAFLSSGSTDVIGNRVVIDISSAAPDAARRIAAHFGVPPEQLDVVSDGTGLLLMPTGRIEGRIIAPPGIDLTMLSPQYDPDVAIGARDAVGIAVEPDGTFVIEDLPPTGYRVYVLELGAAGNREAGEVHVDVPPGGVAVAEIVYEAP